MGDLTPILSDLRALGVRVVFVGNGAPRYIEGFMERTGLAGEDAVVVTDPERKTFEAAGLRRSKWATLGPRALMDAVKVRSRGHRQHGIEGDPYQQGGVLFLDATQTVRFHHVNESLADHASPAEILDAARRIAR